MGYETTALFIETRYETMPGYCNLIATVDLSKACYGNMAKLINKKTGTDEDRIKAIQWRKDYVEFYNDGEYTAKANAMGHDKRKEYGNKLYQTSKELAEKYPYVFYTDGNMQDFTDRYGDFPNVVTVEQFLYAMLYDNAIKEYRRFTVAIAMCESFLKGKQWKNNTIKVMLWGH